MRLGVTIFIFSCLMAGCNLPDTHGGMKTWREELKKSDAALLQGNPELAAVHAWNAKIAAEKIGWVDGEIAAWESYADLLDAAGHDEESIKEYLAVKAECDRQACTIAASIYWRTFRLYLKSKNLVAAEAILKEMEHHPRQESDPYFRKLYLRSSAEFAAEKDRMKNRHAN